MDSLKRVVKVANSTPSEPLNLRRIFGSCGEIRALHASGFIEFADAASAERAVVLKLDLAGVRVYDVASQPRLVDQYRVINPSAFAEVRGIQYNAAVGPSRPSGNYSDSEGRQRTPLGTSHNLPHSSSVPETDLFFRALKFSNTPISRSSGPQAPHQGNISRNVTLPPFAPSFPAAPPVLPIPTLPASEALPPLDARISLRLCGENITLDLHSLAGDPVAVIELLKATSSERGNWLIVGAYYRRIGNPRGAKAVVTSLLEALKQFNLPEADLKPAFLLLSGCDLDLGKISRSKGDPGRASEHYDDAQKWMRKVYGENPPHPVPEPRGTDDSKRASPPRAPASLRSRIDASAPSAPRSHPPPSPTERMLEREIQSLRDRHTHNTNVISDMRSTKRKLEDIVETERAVRRRLQRELDEVVKERDNARRMETLALDEMKREVETRRRAEDRAEGERELRKRAENSAEFAMLPRPPYPRMTPMVSLNDRASPETYSVFDPHTHRISF
ncbi:hypothetical protein B0H15DRAFT_599571 [Mycena belliarum]|uniref:Uncharacterized protein n=1 Tax=Mycena belliarum TaxID=1033014 RepID=A0AAD6TUX5_9AGAR|nr:hypothetical protein B0H15DRAFT_599571 [Mycena belliae]